MSKQVGDFNEFRLNIERAISKSYLDQYFRDIECYYDGGPYSKKDYCLDITLYTEDVANWNGELKQDLYTIIREAGGTGIIGSLRKAPCRHYLDLAFDIKQSELKNYM